MPTTSFPATQNFQTFSKPNYRSIISRSGGTTQFSHTPTISTFSTCNSRLSSASSSSNSHEHCRQQQEKGHRRKRLIKVGGEASFYANDMSVAIDNESVNGDNPQQQEIQRLAHVSHQEDDNGEKEDEDSSKKTIMATSNSDSNDLVEATASKNSDDNLSMNNEDVTISRLNGSSTKQQEYALLRYGETLMLPKHYTEWSVADVARWMAANHFHSYIELFCNRHRIDGRVLAHLSADDLRGEPLSLTVFGDIKRLVMAVTAVREYYHQPRCDSDEENLNEEVDEVEDDHEEEDYHQQAINNCGGENQRRQQQHNRATIIPNGNKQLQKASSVPSSSYPNINIRAKSAKLKQRSEPLRKNPTQQDDESATTSGCGHHFIIDESATTSGGATDLNDFHQTSGATTLVERLRLQAPPIMNEDGDEAVIQSDPEHPIRNYNRYNNHRRSLSEFSDSSSISDSSSSISSASSMKSQSSLTTALSDASSLSSSSLSNSLYSSNSCHSEPILGQPSLAATKGEKVFNNNEQPIDIYLKNSNHHNSQQQISARHIQIVPTITSSAQMAVLASQHDARPRGNISVQQTSQYQQQQYASSRSKQAPPPSTTETIKRREVYDVSTIQQQQEHHDHHNRNHHKHQYHLHHYRHDGHASSNKHHQHNRHRSTSRHRKSGHAHHRSDRRRYDRHSSSHRYHSSHHHHHHHHRKSADAFKPEAWKAILAMLYFFLSTWVTAIVMVIVHDRVPDMDTYPLPDILLDNLPLIPWAFGMCELCGLVLFCIWALILTFHKHR